MINLLLERLKWNQMMASPMLSFVRRYNDTWTADLDIISGKMERFGGFDLQGVA